MLPDEDSPTYSPKASPKASGTLRCEERPCLLHALTGVLTPFDYDHTFGLGSDGM